MSEPTRCQARGRIDEPFADDVVVQCVLDAGHELGEWVLAHPGGDRRRSPVPTFDESRGTPHRWVFEWTDDAG